LSEQDCRIEVVRCRPQVELPAYAHPGDAGMDVRAAEDVLIRPGETLPVPTGLKFGLPRGWEIQIRPRSGLSLKTPLRLPNAPGTIDAGFRDELYILISNSSCPCQCEAGDEQTVFDLHETMNRKGTYLIRAGDRIAQMVFSRVEAVRLTAVDALSEDELNRGGGFGHSGVV
jgi:dUTP pyrophosphatase